MRAGVRGRSTHRTVAGGSDGQGMEARMVVGVRAAHREAGSPRTAPYWRLRFLTVALPALLAGSFGFVRQPLETRLHLPAIAGNVITALLALVGGLVYFQTAYALAARLAADARRAQAERQVLVERQALADELHDSIAQTLFFLNVRLKAALQRARDLGAVDLAGMLGEAATANEQAYGELRQTIRQLAPEPEGAVVGGEAALAEGARGAAARPAGAPGRAGACEAATGPGTVACQGGAEGSGVDPGTRRSLLRLAEWELVGSGVSVEGEGGAAGAPRCLGSEAARVLEAILVEALRNVRKHARAQRVRVWLSEAGGCGRAAVEDDGCGFRPEEARGYGLAAARRRAAEAGLCLAVHSAPGAGTRVEVSWTAVEGAADRWSGAIAR